MPLRRSISRCISRVGLTVALLLAAFRVSAVTSYKQPGFSETVLFSGLTNPTVVRFLPDGRVLVAEKSGLIKIFPNITTNTYTVVADLRTPVHNFWDRGLLGLAVDPNFTTNNYIYVLYAYDAVIGGTPPKWGTAGQTSDPCPGPTSTPPGPGATTDGCVISGRLSRLTATGSDWTASETPLINDWCQQFPSHSTGALDFGADGYLYVSGGDGASFNNSDWGNYGGTVGSPPYTPANPCGDPPFPIGTPQTKPTAEGGALRSQSPRRTAGEPRLLNGSILRVDPATGAAAPGNPLIGSGDVNEQRIIGYGFRNPFRMIVRPGTNEVWIADVGWNTWEELNKIPDLTTARNFGWPCWEGNAAQYAGLNICPTQAQTVAPVLTYNHGASVVAGDGCTVGSSSVAGMAFYQGASNYPSTYPNALFFSDYSRKCVWVMFPDGSGNPNPASTAAFASGAAGPVDLRIGPDGNLYYVDFDGGRIMQVKYGLAAVATANPTSGNAPLTVNFDGSGSVPAQPGDTLSYAWDLDGDGQYDDSAAQQPTWVYSAGGTYTARLRVTDQRGGSAISAPVTITAGAAPPTAIIDTPLSTLTWKVNDTIAFTGHATDPQDGTLAASQLAWTVLIQHCPSNCHSHTYQTFSGVASGSFPAPDHEYPSHLDIQLTATNSHGLTNTATVSINPQTASLNFLSTPAGLQLTVGTSPPQATPFTQTVIVGSVNSVQTASPQGTFPNVWDFGSWSDGGAQDHSITAPAGSSSYTATFATHADLSLAVTPSPEPVGAGATLTYTLTVANAGPSQANSVSLSDSLPAGTTFVSAAGSGWSCSGSGPITCTMGSLGITAASPVTITVTAPAAAGAIVNTASVTSATGDLVAGNNSATTTSNVFARADLAVTQSGAPASICTGQPITYTLNVTNGGPSTATSVSVSDTLPAGAGFVSASGSGWSCSGTATVTCTRASLPTGAAPAITIMITAPAAAGTATNSVSVSSATNDPAAGNNVANASTTVNAVPATPIASNNGPVCAGTTLQLSTPAVPGATYSWTGPNGFASTLQNPAIAGATLAAAGLYSVTVTTNACTSTAGTTAATVRALPTATVSGGAAICAGGATTISAALTGTGPWSVTWSDGVTQSGVAASPATRSVSPAATTTYTVTAVSDANCAGSASGSAVVTISPRPTAAASGSAAICAGAATPLSGSGGATCAWSPAAGLSNAASCSPSASPSATTTYTLTVTDASGCVSNNAPTVTVTVNPKPTATVSGTAAVCAGGATTISAALTGAGPWNVTWSDGVTQSGVAASPATRSVSPAATTTYTVVAVSDTHCAGTSSGSALVTVNPRPTAVAAGSAAICAGTATPLSGSGGATCAWAPASGLSNAASCSPSASPSTTTTYTLTVTDASGCVSNNAPTVTVTINPKPTATVSGTAAVCAGGATTISAALTGAGPWNVTWSDGVTQSGVAASPATRSVSPAATTTYTVVAVSDTHCAGTSSGSALVTVNPSPTAVAGGAAAICVGGATPLSGSGGATCAWAPATGLSDAASCSPSASPSATTTYTLTVTDASGCVSNNAPTVTVTVNPKPTAAVSGSTAICAGGAAVVSAALTGAGPWNVTWSDGVTQSGVAVSPATRSVSPAATTTYTVVAVSDTHCAGTSSGSALVTVNPRPTAVAGGSAAICAGGATPLSGSGGTTCAWAPATGLSDAASCSPSASPSATTTYVLTVTDASGCVSNNAPAVTVTVNAIPPAPTAGNDGPVCVGGTLQLSASTVAGATYAWTGPNGFASALQNPTLVNVPLAAAGLYSVTVAVSGCASAAATTTVAVRGLPTAAVGGSATICQGSATEISAALTGTGPWSVSWSDGVVQSVGASPATRSVQPSSTTTYTVTSVTDAHCAGSGTGSAVVTVGLPIDTPVVTAPLSAAVGALGVAASAVDHAGSAYAWTLTGGTIASGQGTAAITFNSGTPGTTMLLSVVESALACSSPASTAKVQVDFLDVPPIHPFHDFVNTIARNGITVGCGDGTTYCPDAPNTRAQMAVFLLKSKYGFDHVPPPATGLIFLDVPAADPFAPWIEELFALGVSTGCGGGNYCPLAPVTRAQMAVFLLKTLEGATYVPPTATGTIFGDVPLGAFAASWIEELYNRNITGGCQASPLLYCPDKPNTRGQMAVFLTKTFSLQ